MNLSKLFAKEIIELDRSNLDEKDLSQLRRLLLDFVGVSVGGANKPWVTATRKWALSTSTGGPARMIGSDIRVSQEAASMVNGIAAHSNELDDTHEKSLTHPGCVVIPAALAVSTLEITGQEFLTAVTAGYEAIARIGQASDPTHIMSGGFHPTILFGGFGAVVAAAKLMHFNEEELLTAWGHVLSLSGGSMQFSDEVSGTAVKRAHAGYAARNGVTAVQLTKFGVTAPLRPLDGKYGLLKIFGGDTKGREIILGNKQQRLSIHDVSIKPYSCCRLFHSVIDCIDLISKKTKLEIENIAEIVVNSSNVIADQHMLRNPLSSMAAQYSLPYSVGATLAFGSNGYDAYETEHLSDLQISKWSRLVSFNVDAKYEDLYPNHFGASVVVKTTTGETFAAEVLDGSGSPNNPISDEVMATKLERLLQTENTGVDVGRLIEVVEELDKSPNLEEFQSSYMGTTI
jgi:2-methylcitrate dehydratase PrpD